MAPQRGFTFSFLHPDRGWALGFQRVSQARPWLIAVIGAELAIITALFIVPWDTIFASPPPQVPVARAVPLPSPSPSATTQVIQVDGRKAGMVCVMATGKPPHGKNVTLVKVP